MYWLMQNIKNNEYMLISETEKRNHPRLIVKTQNLEIIKAAVRSSGCRDSFEWLYANRRFIVESK